MKKVVDAAGDSLDIIAVHKYSDQPSGVVSHMDQVRSIVQGSSKTKDKPIWLTETGWSIKTSKDCWFKTGDDKAQADKSQALLTLIAAKPWIQKVFFYELRDDDSAGACQRGMLRRNGSEKPWFGTLKSYLQGKSSSNKSNPPTAKSSGGGTVPSGSYRSSCKN